MKLGNIEQSITNLVKDKRFKKIMSRLYGWGASVVVLGALFKLQHWTGAGFMLSLGLITEAVIFFFFAFETGDDDSVSILPKLYKPGSGSSEELPEHGNEAQNAISGGGSLALAKFDAMLENAEITPDMLYGLGTGIKKLGESTANINSLGDVSAASSKYMKTIQKADESLEKLARSYETAISKVTVRTAVKYKGIAHSMSVIEDETKTYQKQMESLNKNISTLNNIYDMQKKGATDYLKDLAESAEDTKKYRDQIKKLNENLTALNSVYGNMLDAMKVK